jgi:prepilin-type N-terminal cleavage/methylation domain-containing protein
MKRRKGFTLIELLAVIVILAIIALIATPTILGVIERAKKGSYEQSANGYVDAIEKQIAINELDSSKDPIVDKVYFVNQLTDAGVTVKGETPEYTEENKSWVKIKNNQVVDYSLKFDDYVVDYDKETNAPIATKNGTLRDMVVSGPTKVNAQEGETHKGIVYLDPTDLTKTCNATNSVSTTETKTGCMKWYIYAEDSSSYKMILDHNTTALVAYNSSGSNSSMNEVATALTNDTSSWDSSLNARLITADEIATITGNTTFSGSTSTRSSWFYFETKTTTSPNPFAGTYAWLYDYTYDCSAYECNIEDNNQYVYSGTNTNYIYGYWTSTPVAGITLSAWHVSYEGDLHNYGVSLAHSVGVRPVVSISKSIIS